MAKKTKKVKKAKRTKKIKKVKKVKKTKKIKVDKKKSTDYADGFLNDEQMEAVVESKEKRRDSIKEEIEKVPESF